MKKTDEIALDSSVLIAHFRNDTAISERLEEFDTLWIPAPVIAEVLFGVLLLAHPEKKEKELDDFLSKVKIIDCTRNVSEKHARIKIYLQSIGKMIPVNDIWIAACCVARNKTLATRDAHFKNVVGLRAEMR